MSGRGVGAWPGLVSVRPDKAAGWRPLTRHYPARTEAIGVGQPGTPQFVQHLVEGWGAGFLVAAGFLAIAGAIAASLVRVSKEEAAAALKEAGAAAG